MATLTVPFAFSCLGSDQGYAPVLSVESTAPVSTAPVRSARYKQRVVIVITWAYLVLFLKSNDYLPDFTIVAIYFSAGHLCDSS